MMHSSHLTTDEARWISSDLHCQSYSIAFVNGCFDPLHHGHIRMLQFAKRRADFVFVAINSDVSIRKIKGCDRPRLPLDQRISSLAELRCVDYIIDFDEDTASELIRAIRPTVVVKGGDYNPSTTREREVIDEVGAELVFAEYVGGISSTHLVDRRRAAKSAGSRIHLVTDLALDTYIDSEASAVSHEFPNVVCLNPTERSSLGGGGNLAVSLNRRSALSSIIAIAGDSVTDDTISELTHSMGIKNVRLPRVKGPYCTRYKKVLARRPGSVSQELLRLDEVPARSNMNAIWQLVEAEISSTTINKGDIIVVSAYENLARSTVGAPIRSLLREMAAERGAILIGACRSACTTLRGFDIIVVNERECLEALSSEQIITRGRVDAVRKFASLVSPSQVVVTIGERGAMFFSRDSGKVNTVATIPCPPGTDPTGAGDVFLAALTGAISQGASLGDSISIAVQCATSALFQAQRPAVAEHPNFDE